MSATALEAIGKVFTDEVLDILLKEGLKGYYDIVSFFQEDTSTHPKDFKHNQVVLKALAVVIEDFMTPDEYIEWLNGNSKEDAS